MSPEPTTPFARQTPTRPAPRIPHRILAASFPWWPTERLARRHPEARGHPFVTAGEKGGRLIITAANPHATRSGLTPGMPLADGRAILPGVVVHPADPAADALALERLARWADRFTPRVMPDRVDTLLLDIGGCDRLFGGEEALMASLRVALEDFGLTVRLALADTPGAAWALSHYGTANPAMVAAAAGPSGLRDALAELPVAALRLSADVADALASFGLDRICTLSVMESVKLIRRFGMEPVRRLRQALGLVEEPITPLRPPLPREAHRAFAEPISTAADIHAAVDDLLDDLCLTLNRSGEGARRLHLVCHRADGNRRTLTVGTSRPLRRKKPLMGLFAEKLDQVEPGFGIDEIVLATDVVEILDEVQTDWYGETAGGYRAVAEEEVVELLDRLGNRFGFARIVRPTPRQSWLPERAVSRHKPLTDCGDAAANWPIDRRRPLRLFSPPEPVEAVTPEFAGPPLVFHRSGKPHRVSASEGPERLGGEWWREDAPHRDYYLAEDDTGRRYWLYRDGAQDTEAVPRWFLHGLFA